MILLQQLKSNTQQLPHKPTMSREELVNTLRELVEELNEIGIQENRCTEHN
jgi:hypothetical protein